MQGKSNMRLFGVLTMAVAVIAMIAVVFVLPMSQSPASGDQNKNNLITCTVSVYNDAFCVGGIGCAHIETYQCQAISQCGFKDGFGSPPSTGTQLLIGGASKSISYQNNFGFHTDQISICVPSTSTTGVLKLFKEGNERDSKMFTVGG